MRAAILPALLSLSLPLVAQARIEGSYRLVSAVDLTRGIAQATEDLPLFERMYARHRLSDVNPLYKTISLKGEGVSLDLRFDGRDPLHLTEGQEVAWTREDGEPFSVGLKTQGRRFTQVYRGREGKRTNAFYLTPGGQTLILEVTVNSHKLPKALRYHLVYEKAPAA